MASKHDSPANSPANSPAIQEKEGVIVAKAGGISESGTLKALKKKGHDQYSAFSELIDGAADAGANQLTITDEIDFVTISDDGDGQRLKDFVNSFNLGCQKTFDKSKSGGESKEHKKRLCTKGAAGNGTKAAIVRLCPNGTVYVYNKHKDSDYLKAIIPVKEIFEKMRWTERVDILANLPVADIEFYRKYNSDTGWCIKIPKTPEITTTLKEQFVDEYCDLPQAKIWGFRYGTEPMKITYQDERGNLHEIKKYNPFDNNIHYLFPSEILKYNVYKNKQTGEYL